MYEEDSSIFHLPTENFVAPVAAQPESVKTTATVAETAEVVATEQPAKLVDAFSHSEKLSDQALFNELNAVSEEVIKCRDHILSNIS